MYADARMGQVYPERAVVRRQGGACRRCGSDADAAGDGDRDFGEREVTAGIPAGRKGSKGRMWIPEDGAPGDGWRG